MDDWREAVWRAVPEGAEPERFTARRAFLLDRVAPGEHVLDLGCGDGAFAEALVAAGCAVTMADVAEEALRRARVRASQAHAVRLAEVRRVLCWGGRLLVTTPWHGRIVVATDAHFDPRADHLRFFSARTLRAVLEDAGFAEIEVRRAGGGLHASAA